MRSIWSAVASTGVPSAATALGWSQRDTPLDRIPIIGKP